jgi:hypothetical protein
MNRQVGIIVNASRSIIYADGNDVEGGARRAAQKVQQEMATLLQQMPA